MFAFSAACRATKPRPLRMEQLKSHSALNRSTCQGVQGCVPTKTQEILYTARVLPVQNPLQPAASEPDTKVVFPRQVATSPFTRRHSQHYKLWVGRPCCELEALVFGNLLGTTGSLDEIRLADAPHRTVPSGDRGGRGEGTFVHQLCRGAALLGAEAVARVQRVEDHLAERSEGGRGRRVLGQRERKVCAQECRKRRTQSLPSSTLAPCCR